MGRGYKGGGAGGKAHCPKKKEGGGGSGNMGVGEKWKYITPVFKMPLELRQKQNRIGWEHAKTTLEKRRVEEKAAI